MEGIMNTLAVPFGWVMKACYWFTGIFGGNYVIALLIFALIMQILLSPFGFIQQKNSQKQAKMRPMEYLIRKKYAGRNDRATQQKMQNEIMELYQKEGYNPLSGCLPMLLQLVIIFPLYYVVVNPLTHLAGLGAHAVTILNCFNQYSHANGGSLIEKKNGYEVILSGKILGNQDKFADIFKGWAEVTEGAKIPGVEAEAAKGALDALNVALDPGTFKFIPSVEMFGFDLGALPSEALSAKFTSLWFLILIPVLNLGFTYLSQFVSKKLNPQPMQEASQQQAGGGMLNSMKIMLWAMPLMTFFFTFMFPAAIGVYWIFRTLLSMLQQFIISRIIKIPKYTEEDLKQIEKEMKEAKKKAGAKPDIVYNNGEVKPYRSLHHIDDDE